MIFWHFPKWGWKLQVSYPGKFIVHVWFRWIVRLFYVPNRWFSWGDKKKFIKAFSLFIMVDANLMVNASFLCKLLKKADYTHPMTVQRISIIIIRQNLTIIIKWDLMFLSPKARGTPDIFHKKVKIYNPNKVIMVWNHRPTNLITKKQWVTAKETFEKEVDCPMLSKINLLVTGLLCKHVHDRNKNFIKILIISRK